VLPLRGSQGLAKTFAKWDVNKTSLQFTAAEKQCWVLYTYNVWHGLVMNIDVGENRIYSEVRSMES
jgi:hypothetical protein